MNRDIKYHLNCKAHQTCLYFSDREFHLENILPSKVANPLKSLTKLSQIQFTPTISLTVHTPIPFLAVSFLITSLKIKSLS